MAPRRHKGLTGSQQEFTFPKVLGNSGILNTHKKTAIYNIHTHGFAGSLVRKAVTEMTQLTLSSSHKGAYREYCLHTTYKVSALKINKKTGQNKV